MYPIHWKHEYYANWHSLMGRFKCLEWAWKRHHSRTEHLSISTCPSLQHRFVTYFLPNFISRHPWQGRKRHDFSLYTLIGDQGGEKSAHSCTRIFGVDLIPSKGPITHILLQDGTKFPLRFLIDGFAFKYAGRTEKFRSKLAEGKSRLLY